MRLKYHFRERRMHIAKVNSINFKQRSFKICVLLGLYFIFISSYSSVLGTDFSWEGIDDQDYPVTFTVTDDDMQWFNFTMILVHPGDKICLLPLDQEELSTANSAVKMLQEPLVLRDNSHRRLLQQELILLLTIQL